MREAMARHAQRVERIDAGSGIAQRLQNTREGLDAARKRAGGTVAEPHGAQRPVVECDALMRTAAVRYIGGARGHTRQQVLEQQRVERHGDTARVTPPVLSTRRVRSICKVSNICDADRSPAMLRINRQRCDAVFKSNSSSPDQAALAGRRQRHGIDAAEAIRQECVQFDVLADGSAGLPAACRRSACRARRKCPPAVVI